MDKKQKGKCYNITPMFFVRAIYSKIFLDNTSFFCKDIFES